MYHAAQTNWRSKWYLLISINRPNQVEIEKFSPALFFIRWSLILNFFRPPFYCSIVSSPTSHFWHICSPLQPHLKRAYTKHSSLKNNEKFSWHSIFFSRPITGCKTFSHSRVAHRSPFPIVRLLLGWTIRLGARVHSKSAPNQASCKVVSKRFLIFNPQLASWLTTTN